MLRIAICNVCQINTCCR